MLVGGSDHYDQVPIDMNVPQAARRYNALLGGKDNFGVDRDAADQLEDAFPNVRIAADENRRFVLRMVHHLAADRGIRQFLDIGSGLPADTNVHDVAQRIHPDARVVYVDNDPVVAAHARALLIGNGEGRCEFIPGDLRHPRMLLANPTLRTTFDLDQPVAVLIMAVLHFIPDIDNPQQAVRVLLDGLPEGSYLALSHGSGDLLPADTRAQLEEVAANPAQGVLVSRTRQQVEAFSEGMHVIEPGVASVVDLLPATDPKPYASASDAPLYGVLVHVVDRCR